MGRGLRQPCLRDLRRRSRRPRRRLGVGCSVSCPAATRGSSGRTTRAFSASPPCSRKRAGAGVGKVLGTTVLDWAAAEGYGVDHHGLARNQSPLIAHLAEARVAPDVPPALPRHRLTARPAAGWMGAWCASPSCPAPVCRSSRSTTTRSCCCRPHRSIRCGTSPPRSARRSATRSRGRASPISSPAAAASVIVVEPRSLPFPGAPSDPRRGGRAPSSTSSSASACGPSGRRSSSPAGSNAGPAAASGRASSARRRRATSTARWSCTTRQTRNCGPSGSTAAPRCTSTDRCSTPT